MTADLDQIEKLADAVHDRDRPVEAAFERVDELVVGRVGERPAHRPIAEVLFVMPIEVGEHAIHVEPNLSRHCRFTFLIVSAA